MFAPDPTGQFSFKRGSKDALDGAACTMTLGEISRFSLNGAGAPAARGGWTFGAVFQSSSAHDDDLILDQIFSAKSIEFPLNSAEGLVNNISFNSPHSGGAQFAFADASVRFISDSVSVDVLKTLASTNGLEKPEQMDR
jgi:prepilin-type processing-associated H-X9-DG protein